MALCLAASPADAKKHVAEDTSDRGGLFQPPAATNKPNLVLDTSIPKVLARKGDALRQGSPDAGAPGKRNGAAQSDIVPVRAYAPTRSIESMRVHSLFE